MGCESLEPDFGSLGCDIVVLLASTHAQTVWKISLE